MKVLVIGNGGREHALCWHLAQRSSATEVFCAPGSDAIAEHAQPVPIKVDEVQSLADFADGIKNITEAQQRVALEYFESGGVEDACPPIKSLLHIMAHGDHDGLTPDSPELRAMFELDNVLSSDWYQRRLEMQQRRDITACQKQIAYLESVLGDEQAATDAAGMDLPARLDKLRVRLAQVQAEGYVASLQGALGADPLG